MWMPVNELIANTIQAICYVPTSFFSASLARDLSIKHHVQKQITRFLLYLFDVIVQDCLRQFIRFLNGQMPQALQGLLAVPGTFLPQFFHDFQQAFKRSQFLFHRMHAAKVRRSKFGA